MDWTKSVINIFYKIKCVLIYFLLSVYFIQFLIMCVITAKCLLCFNCCTLTKLCLSCKWTIINDISKMQTRFTRKSLDFLFDLILKTWYQRGRTYLWSVSPSCFFFHIWHSAEFLCYIAIIKIFNLNPREYFAAFSCLIPSPQWFGSVQRWRTLGPQNSWQVNLHFSDFLLYIYKYVIKCQGLD